MPSSADTVTPEKFLTVTAAEFKIGMRHLAAAVNVITAAYEGDRTGLTATAACSVSADPPQLLICVNTDSRSHAVIDKARAFCLNVLAEDQENIARRFAGMDGTDRAERFALGRWTELVTGAPVLEGTMASFDCRVVQQISVGTHTVFVGNVDALTIGNQDTPLMYGIGKFAALELGG